MTLKTFMIVAYLMSHPVAQPVFSIYSPAFKQAATIPERFTCRGKDVSIPLNWSGVPEGTKSLALIIIDRDVPRKAWYHWAVYNIPPTITSFRTDVKLKAPIQQATNSWGNAKYQGPCPPSGEHHYVIQLYALDTVLPVQPNVTTLQLREMMRDHVISTTQTMGRVNSREENL